MKKFICILTASCILFCMNFFIPLSAAGVTFSVNFDEEPDGAHMEETALGEEFIIAVGTPDSGAIVEEDSAGGSLLSLTGYTDIKSVTYFEKSYTFSIDFISDADNTAVFVRGVEPSEYIQAENPKNQNVVQTFNYYEWDWYQENGGTAGASSIGGSGIFIMPSASAIKIGLKLYQDDGLGVSTKIFNLPVPEGYTRGEKCTIKIEDTVTSVSVSLNGTALAVIDLSEPGTKYDADDPSYEFYKKATVKNAAGEELGTVENTRISSEYSQIAITTRNAALRIDNVILQHEEEVSTPTQTPSDPTKAPETESAKPVVTSKVTKTPAGSTKAPGNSNGSDRTPILIAIIAACVVVAGGITAAILIAKKKRK